MRTHRIRQKGAASADSVSRVIVTSVVLAALTCAALLVPPLWAAIVQAWNIRPTGEQICRVQKDATARRACYEQLPTDALPRDTYPRDADAPPPRPAGE